MTILNRDTTTPEPGEPSWKRPSSAWASLRNRNYRLFWLGGLVSNTGRWFQSVAIPAIIWELTESAAWVGFAGFSRMAPMAIVELVDRDVDAKGAGDKARVAAEEEAALAEE